MYMIGKGEQLAYKKTRPYLRQYHPGAMVIRATADAWKRPAAVL